MEIIQKMNIGELSPRSHLYRDKFPTYKAAVRVQIYISSFKITREETSLKYLVSSFKLCVIFFLTDSSCV